MKSYSNIKGPSNIQEPGKVEDEFASAELIKGFLSSRNPRPPCIPKEIGFQDIAQNWELTAPFSGCKIQVPTKFVVGDLDLTYHVPGIKEYIHNGGFKKEVPNLQEVVVMEGVAHFINQEKPDETSAHIYEFIQKF
ncbi:hypothetical protein K7X08_010997 [Anisodus acutangulus]|uniref:Uncharacterized protein n=1 Tax=Anisodus acutangulus TaxID=402998 RepID=A0A9Q1LYB4_9SOLA|nr:hypothetical protein K7X08_010997 [Anisodus acutangulus]